MTEPNARPYTASVTYDLPTYQERLKGDRFFYPRVSILLILSMLWCIIYSIALYPVDQDFLSFMLFLFMGVFWGVRLIFHFLNKNGGSNFKRMLASNNSKPIHYEYTFLPDGIHTHETVTNATVVIPYREIVALWETENLFMISLEYKRLHAFHKSSLCGGPLSAFVPALLAVCPRIKKKKLRSLLPGKIIYWIFIGFSVLSILLALWICPPARAFREAGRSINSTMTYRQIARELELLGIGPIDEEVLQTLDGYESMEFSPSYYSNSTAKCTSVLVMAGMGTYAPDTWEWMPAQCGVYWFDSEAFDVGNMYKDLLLGISALDKTTLCFTDLQEDLSGINWETGTGTRSVSFHWNGKTHMLQADTDYDWYDLSVLNQLNKIIKEECDGKQLYFAWDHGQGYLVFFGDKSWAKHFEAATGIKLYTNPLATVAHY